MRTNLSKAPRLTAVAISTAFALSNCSDEVVLRRLPEPEVQIDELKQKAAALVDILWVVDNSQSMVDEQAGLASNFDRFITGLTICQGSEMADDVCDFDSKTCTKSGNPCNPPDYHIGVISTDVVATVDQGRLRRVGICVPNLGSAPMNSKFKYCAGNNTDCQQDPMNPDPQFDPANAVCDMSQSISFITPTTAGAANAFSRAVRVGVGGSGLERGIQAAAMALGRDADRQTGQFNPAPTENGGFLRNDASLFVIFVSDEDDSSFGEVSYFYRAFESLKAAGNEGLISFSAIVGDPDPDGSGPMRGGCPPEPSTPIAAAGTRYVGLAMYTRGLSSEFRVCDDTRLTCESGSSCEKPIGGFPTAGGELGVCVPTGACQTDQDCGNFKCGEEGCIACENATCVAKAERFVPLLERNGIFGSICAPDYGIVLGALGFEAAGLSRKFELTKFPDCSQQVECGTATAPVCVKVAGEVIPNDRATGWVWEPSANAIFFDGSFVPPTDAPVEVTYRIARAGAAEATMALGCDTALK